MPKSELVSRPVRAHHREGDDGLARPAAEVVDVERDEARQEDQLRREHRQLSQGHRPNSASQIRVKTRVRSTPPQLRMNSSRALACARRPPGHRRGGARRRPRRWSTARAARRRSSPRCRPRAGATGSSAPTTAVCSAVRMPRNSRSRRSSASMVTFVSSSPFHQPSRAAEAPTQGVDGSAEACRGVVVACATGEEDPAAALAICLPDDRVSTLIGPVRSRIGRSPPAPSWGRAPGAPARGTRGRRASCSSRSPLSPGVRRTAPARASPSRLRLRVSSRSSK